MRIRKRAVPFPLSSLLPVPISDPLINLNRPPPVPAVVQLHPGGPSSDRPIGPPVINGSDFPHKEEEKKRQDCSELLFLEDEGEKKKKGNDNMRKYDNLNIFSSAQAVSGSAYASNSTSTTSPRQVLVPPKKRRGSGSRSGSFDAAVKKKTITDTDTATSTADREEKIGQKRGGRAAGGRGGALMEGSRCSRVNGRGWRCCQQTLVGYSLCEHHLGKGRLRSIAAVRGSASRSAPLSKPTVNTAGKSILAPGGKGDDDRDRDHDHDHDGHEMVKGRSKRTKLGMVKARSISSLLGQPNTSATSSSPLVVSTTSDDIFGTSGAM